MVCNGCGLSAAASQKIILSSQPTVTTVIVGATFLVSIPLGNPLAQKLAYDVFPFDDAAVWSPR